MQFFVNGSPVCGDTVPLGVQGENLATQITADVSGWLAQWPDGQVIVRLIDANRQSHLADTVVDDGTLVWIVTAADTAQGGYGVGVIELVQGDVVKKSEPFATRVITDPQASGQAPEPVPGWVEETITRMQAIESDAENSANAAQTAAEQAQAVLPQVETIITESLQQAKESGEFDGPQGPQGVPGERGEPGEPGADGVTFTPAVSSEGVISWTNNGGKTNPQPVNIKGPTGQAGPAGADGVSPAVTVTPIIGGHQVMITDAEGEHTFDVTNGEDGLNGKPGADGFSPVATVTQTQTGATISITDKAGTTTAQISNGPKGDPGEVTQTEFDDLAGEVTDLKSQIDEISKKGIDASGATAGQVPVADGQGSWAWGNVSGDAMILGPEEIQKLVADGKAKSAFNIGDVIYIPWTNYTPSTPVVYQFPFVVVHIGDVYDQNDVLHHDALWLMAMYAEPEEIMFDAAEDTVVNLSTEPNALEGWYYWGLTGTNYTELNLSAGDAIPTTYGSVHKCAINNLSVLRYGYNRWRDSAYRQWLNSDAAKSANWWTSQHDGDVAPTATYTNKPGWLYGFENRWLDVIKPVRVQTATNTVTDGGVTDVTFDRFFLPSLEQMYGKPHVAGVEGDYWEYWKEETGLDAPSNGSSGDPNEARKIPSVVNYPRGSAVYCRLRSASRGNGLNVWFVYTGGYLNGTAASSAYRALPACVIY